MTTTPETSAAASVLAAARESRRTADAAEADILAQTLAWIELHTTDDPTDAAVWGDTPVHLGGEGCPWVREFTITELAAALGMSPASGRRLVSDVLELVFRLPRLWAKVQAGRVPAWRARAVADRTQHLTPEAASFVDAQVCEFVNKMSRGAIDRLVDEAIARFMPALAKQQREAAADQRCFTIDHGQVSFAGTALIQGELDLADAIDLDTALAHIAGELKDLGNELPLDQRRALAAGELARRQFAMTYEWDARTPQEIAPASVEERPKNQKTTETTTRSSQNNVRRDVVLYAHLSADAITTMTTAASTGSAAALDPNAVVRLEGHGGQLVTLETLRDWLKVDGDTRVTIRPVLDLNARLVSAGRFASDLQREQLHLRDHTCVAPHCNRPARRLDADHVEPWDDDGPPGQTSSDNLGSLCRHHHRAKTLTGWTYTQLFPGVFFWESPHGLRFLTFQGQTIDLNA